MFVYLKDIAHWLRERTMLSKVLIVLCVDFGCLSAAVLLAFMLRVSSLELPPTGFLWLYFLAPFLSILSLAAFGIYGSASRAYSFHIERRIAYSQIVVPPAWALILVFLGTNGFARSVILIYGILAILVLTTLRRLAALMFKQDMPVIPRKERISVLIYGAGQEGIQLVDSLNQQGRYRPMAFVDTDYTLIGRSVNGLSVFATENLNAVIAKYRPAEVLIAKPNQNRASRRILVDMFLEHGLQVKVIPGLDEIVNGNIDVSALRPIRLEDLLGRDPVPPNKALMEKAVKNRIVMVTGAGGSIGSELVRQTVQFGPKKIVMVDNNEYSLFEIHREIENTIQQSPDQVSLVPLLVDVQNQTNMKQILVEERVDVVFHAAAYKHVRMVQDNSAAGIQNNIWGTKSVAEASMEAGVGLFVMVSTDKAVRPTSVMGASKRVAEMIVQALARHKKNRTIFTMVRFGNVLGSTGSVVPLFREQIAKGGPVTVTHTDVTRYFMLISEAAQLVIQAGAMANAGEVFVLDMGEAVKIVALAETMIELAGMSVKSDLNPTGDIEIVFTGLRDGEKLYEELQIGRDISNTENPRIMRSNEFYLPVDGIYKALAELETHLKQRKDDRAVQLVMDLSRLGS
jgi:UDP-N-acetylglucosamine 4,6-dehydratase